MHDPAPLPLPRVVTNIDDLIAFQPGAPSSSTRAATPGSSTPPATHARGLDPQLRTVGARRALADLQRVRAV